MNTRHFLIVTAILLGGMTLADDKKSDGATHVDPNAAEKLVKEGKVTVVDVRTINEYKQGHIAGAKNIDFTESDFEGKVAKLDKSKPYLVHCASGHRSTNSLETFKKLGFQSIYHLDGGLKAWEGAGKPVEKN
jgi:rhodanese-related sulfurtransferase